VCACTHTHTHTQTKRLSSVLSHTNKHVRQCDGCPNETSLWHCMQVQWVAGDYAAMCMTLAIDGNM
jgi:hypothetical protein